MTSSLQYQGALAETSLAEMFFTVYRHRVPGLIEIRRDEVTKKVFIKEGSVIHASSTDRSDSLGAYLYREGRLTREELSRTMKEREGSGQRYGELLVAQQILSPKELHDAVRGQMESIIWSLFSWQEGEVSFRIGEFQDPTTVRIHIPMRRIIVRGIKRVPDPKSLVAQLGKKTTIFRPNFNIEDLIDIALDADEYSLLRLVDGSRTLYQICTDGPFPVSENARLLYAFHVLHLIERATADPSTAVTITM